MIFSLRPKTVGPALLGCFAASSPPSCKLRAWSKIYWRAGNCIVLVVPAEVLAKVKGGKRNYYIFITIIW